MVNQISRESGRAVWMMAGVLLAGAMGGGLPCEAADVLASHPARPAIERAGGQEVEPTGVDKREYLRLIAGNVDYFRQFQDKDGAIIDPVSRGERQYSTPAFALAAGILVAEAGREDLLDPAVRAMSCALTALVENRAADKHPDFYIPMLMHAHRLLAGRVDAATARRWGEQLRQIDPETVYRAELRHMNWNIVSGSGELLRRKDGLVNPPAADAQLAYLDRCMEVHMQHMKPIGLFEDPGAPMVYDAFSRLWLEDAFADDAGAVLKQAGAIERFLRTGGLTSLAVISPAGEWAIGGRSALHNWADAQMAAVFEINAGYWKRAGRQDIAGSFKRAARLAVKSVAQWQRPSGELWIVKNRAEPQTRFGYEGYSNHSQYNLLPMAMLAIAYCHADETIKERLTPAEAGGYVLDARDSFYKVVGAAGGYQALIETGSDLHYNATGLQRISRVGQLFSAYGDTAAAERGYQPKDGAKAAIAAGLQWQAADGTWLGLGDFGRGAKGRRVSETRLNVLRETPDMVELRIDYVLKDGESDAGAVQEVYRISAEGVVLQATARVPGATNYRVQVPVLVWDGAEELPVELSGGSVAVRLRGELTTMTVDGSARMTLEEQRVATHQGFVRRGVVPVPGNTATIRITLSR